MAGFFVNTRYMTEREVLIYIVDDESLSRELLEQALEGESWQVRSFSAGNDLMTAIASQPCDIAMVDIGLPDIDGFELTKTLIAQSQCGVLMVTARQDMESRVEGLQIGADAYLVKPIEPRELVATIRALLRRLERVGAFDAEARPRWSFDPRNWRLITPDQQIIELTHTECLFLDTLIRHSGEAVERDQIITAIGHSPTYYHSSRLDTMVCRLRNKITAHTPDWQPVVTCRALGYAFVPD